MIGGTNSDDRVSGRFGCMFAGDCIVGCSGRGRGSSAVGIQGCGSPV